MTPTERSQLLDALLDGSITEADLVRIEAEMSVDPHVREEYYRRIQLEILLEREFGLSNEQAAIMPPTVPAIDGQHAAPQREPGISRRFSRGALLFGIMLGVAASLLLMVTMSPRGTRETPGVRTTDKTSGEPSAVGFAILNGQSDATWVGRSINEGDLLPAGELHLRSGRARIELFSGVQIVIEGESRFSIDSPMQMTMVSGRARAHVPEPAQGFVVKTESGDVVDLGTEFAVNVDRRGADVQVLDGEVELRPHASDVRRMNRGNSLRLNPSGSVTEANVQELGMIGPRDFQDLLQKQQSARLSQWLEATRQTRSDPRLIAYYQFTPESGRSRQLRNRASSAGMPASDGAVVAAQSAVDRWGRNNAALDFTRVGSRVRVVVPGEHRGLTLMCWVRIDSLDRWYNSLFLTDGHEDREPHWQIMDDGRIFFSVKLPRDDRTGKPVKQREYYSPVAWNASLSGRWIMLAIVYDVDRKAVTHYLNGKPISSEPIPEQDLVESIRIGAASIGNWSEPMYSTDPKFVLRNLNGSMDEFALFSGALSAEEISQWYRVGNPNEL